MSKRNILISKDADQVSDTDDKASNKPIVADSLNATSVCDFIIKKAVDLNKK